MHQVRVGFISKDYLFILRRRHGHRCRTVEEGVDPRATQFSERGMARVERIAFKGDILRTKPPRSTSSEEKGWPVEEETLICYDTPSSVCTMVDATFSRTQFRQPCTVERLFHFVRYVYVRLLHCILLLHPSRIGHQLRNLLHH